MIEERTAKFIEEVKGNIEGNDSSNEIINKTFEQIEREMRSKVREDIPYSLSLNRNNNFDRVQFEANKRWLPIENRIIRLPIELIPSQKSKHQ